MKTFFYALSLALVLRVVPTMSMGDENFDAKVAASKEAAAAKFPELKDPQSRLFKLVAESTPTLKANNPEMFEEPNWPMKVSKYCVKMIRQYDTAQKEAEEAANRQSRQDLIDKIADYEALMGFYRNDRRATKNLVEWLDFLRLQLARLPDEDAPAGGGGAPASSIQSRIDGEFNGWDGDTVVKLENGQVWQQVDFRFRFAFKFRPKVTVFRTDGSYYMIIDGVDDKVKVRQVR